MLGGVINEYYRAALADLMKPRSNTVRSVLKRMDGADSAWPARAIGAGSGRVSAREKVSMPAQRRLWPHQQPEPAKHVLWEPVQQGGQERPVAGEEPRPGLAQLSLQDRDLVT